MPNAITPESLSAEQYAQALTDLASDNDRKMLEIHYRAPAQTITAEQMSNQMGWAGLSAANRHYGTLGQRLADYFGAAADYDKIRLSFCVSFVPPDKEGNQSWLWILRPQLAKALEILGWVKTADMRTLQENEDESSATGRVPIMISRIKRDSALVCEIKKLHDYKCQICGQTIELAGGDTYAEAHHIQPLGGEHKGPDKLENMLCVCPNHHVQLDFCAIKLDLVKLRKQLGHSIDLRFVEYHNERVRE